MEMSSTVKMKKKKNNQEIKIDKVHGWANEL